MSGSKNFSGPYSHCRDRDNRDNRDNKLFVDHMKHDNCPFPKETNLTKVLYF